MTLKTSFILTSIIGVILLLSPLQIIAEEDAEVIAAAKAEAHMIIQTAFGLYTEANYTAENWNTLVSYRTSGDVEVDAALDLAQILLAHTTATNGMSQVQTDLADAKAFSHTAINDAFATYGSGNYTAENWTALVAFKDNGNAEIDRATDIAQVISAETTATGGMAGVEVDIVLAKSIAHTALTDARAQYNEGNYSAGNWIQISDYKTNGDTAIDEALDITAIRLAQTTAVDGMSAVVTDLLFEKNAAHERLATLFNVYSERDFTPEDYIDFVAQKNAGDLAITNTPNFESMSSVEAAAHSALLGVPTLIKRLADAKTNGHAILDDLFGTYHEADYSAENWVNLVQFKTSGGDLIETSRTVGEVDVALVQTENNMNSVARNVAPASVSVPTSRSGHRSILRVSQVTTTQNTGRVLGAATFNFSTDLYIGLRNDAVQELQEKLRAQGFYSGVSSTGYYGPITQAAVKAFQSAHGIPATGYVGALTREALNL